MKRRKKKKTDIIEFAREKFARFNKDKCEERDCKLSIGITKKRNYIILKGDEIYKDRKMCDCIILIRKGKCFLVIAELKNRDIDAGDIVEKHRNSLKFARELVKQSVNRLEEIEYYPVLLHKGVKTVEIRRFRQKRNKIRFCKDHRFIIIKKCGSTLSDVIDDII